MIIAWIHHSLWGCDHLRLA